MIAGILGKLSLVRKKYLQTFKTMWYCILIFCKKIINTLTIGQNCIYLSIYLLTYFYINLFPYLFISLFIHYFFSSLRINQCYYLLLHILFAQFIFY